jgi:tetratricopeptide (TPR) repeat protein
LKFPDNLHLQAAHGWLELGLPLEADKELDEITPELRARPDVLLVRCEVYFQAKKWEHVVAVAETLVKMLPKEPQVWIQRSFALHELGRTQEAFEHLLPVGRKFRKVWTIPYNLACYCAQLGRLDECQVWFKKAMAIDEHNVKRKAIDDPDLKPLWDSMSGTMWRRCD